MEIVVYMWLKETIHVCSTVVDKCEKESINVCKNKLFEDDETWSDVLNNLLDGEKNSPCWQDINNRIICMLPI